MTKIERVAFMGYADAKEDGELYGQAYEVAKLCAQSSYTVVNGGGPGIMKAATLGAKSAGGKTIGITFYPKDLMLFEGRDESNPVDELIVEDNYVTRTLKLLEVGQTFIFFNGGTGTISEFAMAWGLARLYYGHHKPLILYGDFWHKIIFEFTKSMYIRPEERQVFRVVNKPEDVIEAIEELEKRVVEQGHEHSGPFSI